jgi:hypothetical protein
VWWLSATSRLDDLMSLCAQRNKSLCERHLMRSVLCCAVLSGGVCVRGCVRVPVDESLGVEVAEAQGGVAEQKQSLAPSEGRRR